MYLNSSIDLYAAVLWFQILLLFLQLYIVVVAIYAAILAIDILKSYSDLFSSKYLGPE